MWCSCNKKCVSSGTNNDNILICDLCDKLIDFDCETNTWFTILKKIQIQQHKEEYIPQRVLLYPQ